MPEPPNPFQYFHRVTYADCTMGNHVYYARYLEILEAARGEFFRARGQTLVDWQAQDAIFPVVECRLRYRSAARYDEELRVEVWLTRAEGARLDFGYRIRGTAERLVLEGETMHVCTAMDEKPKRLPRELMDLATKTPGEQTASVGGETGSTAARDCKHRALKTDSFQ